MTAAKLEEHDDEIKWMEVVNRKFEQCEEKVNAYLVEDTLKENPKEKNHWRGTEEEARTGAQNGDFETTT
jgi:hypothetical protein